MSDKWYELQKEWGEWSESVFGKHETTEKLSEHLIEEINECKENPQDVYEHVDCLMMVLNKARLHGFTTEDLYIKALEKLEINKNKRQWVKHSDGIFRHIDD